MRFHVLGLPYTQTNKDWCECAYTQKVLNFCKMMTDLGHETIHYGAEGAIVAGHHITVMGRAEQVAYCGERDKQTNRPCRWNSDDPLWTRFNAACIGEISGRLGPRDFICHINHASEPVAKYFGDKKASNVEYGIGYGGSSTKWRAFESTTMQHEQWANEGWDIDGKNYDWVIPNYYDVNDFPEGPGGDYLLFVGRVIWRKGLNTATLVAKHLGMRLVVAGPGADMPDGLPGERRGVPIVSGGRLNGHDGRKYEGCIMEYAGHVDVEARGELMRHARAILVPTYYIEPFGGVNVEAQLCGTPAITSPWGGFKETVAEGKSGFLPHTLKEWIQATEYAGKLNRKKIRKRAIEKYSLPAVGKQFEKFFNSINDRWLTKDPHGPEGGWSVIPKAA